MYSRIRKASKLFSGIFFLSSTSAFADEQLRQTTPKESESQILASYSGVIGTAPKNTTVSSAGGAFELSPNNLSLYEFFSQTLSNDIYYELRLTQRDNYVTSNPNIPGIPASNVMPPMGYGFTGIFGYNFHPTDATNITPFIRLQVQKNTGPVYQDTDGDYLNSVTYVAQLGAKFSFKATPVFAPYITLRGGYQYNQLNGAYPASKTQNAEPISGVLNQIVFIYEIGLATKITPSFAVTPYTQFSTTSNYPDPTAQLAIDQGGLNQTNLTGTSQAYGLKVSYNW